MKRRQLGIKQYCCARIIGAMFGGLILIQSLGELFFRVLFVKMLTEEISSEDGL